MQKYLILATFFIFNISHGITSKEIQNSRWRGIYNALLQSICGKEKKCSKQEQDFVIRQFMKFRAQIIQSNMKPYKLQSQIYTTAEQIAMYGIQKAQTLLNERLKKLQRFQRKKAAFVSYGKNKH